MLVLFGDCFLFYFIVCLYVYDDAQKTNRTWNTLKLKIFKTLSSNKCW
jgi:hypothetical protein